MSTAGQGEDYTNGVVFQTGPSPQKQASRDKDTGYAAAIKTWKSYNTQIVAFIHN